MPRRLGAVDQQPFGHAELGADLAKPRDSGCGAFCDDFYAQSRLCADVANTDGLAIRSDRRSSAVGAKNESQVEA